ncbi:MAG: pyridoxamine 5'-phosphate oxidase family protein [Bacillota bacterium]
MRGQLRMSSRAMNPEDAEDLLARAPVGHLGTFGVDGYPYVTPLFYAYLDGRIYFHCAPEGHKIDNIKQCPRVCFEVCELDQVVGTPSSPCEASAKFKSVVAFGKARPVTDPDEKLRALTHLVAKYGFDPSALPPEASSACTVVSVDVEFLTGKAAR